MWGHQYYWHTPQPSILQGGADRPTETIANPAYIAQLMTAMGIQCVPVGYTSGAQIATYHYDLARPGDYVKVDRAIQCVSAAIHAPCRTMVSDHASFAVQVAKTDRRIVTLRQVIGAPEFGPSRTRTTAALGLDDAGRPVMVDVAKLPHMLIAGATGSGKSVAINTILCSMLYCACPGMTQLVLIDPKQVELSAYAGLPHLACPIVTGPGAAVKTLARINATMDQRYRQLARLGVRDIEQTDMPRIVVVIDELADLMLTSKRAVEDSIIRIAQLGRAAGIHLIIATQKPVVSVVTGLIQGNIPCKLALQTASVHDSVRILGHKGAESLLGRGDALLKLPDRVAETRLQCAYTSDSDVAAVVNYWRYDAKR